MQQRLGIVLVWLNSFFFGKVGRCKDVKMLVFVVLKTKKVVGVMHLFSHFPSHRRVNFEQLFVFFVFRPKLSAISGDGS